jgi:hypothetical protein
MVIFFDFLDLFREYCFSKLIPDSVMTLRIIGVRIAVYFLPRCTSKSPTG